MDKETSKQIGLRFKENLIEESKKLIQYENRTFNNYVETALIEYNKKVKKENNLV